VPLASLVAIGFVAASVVAIGGYRARALSEGGAIAATFVGTAIFGLGGLRWAAVMVTFFVLSSALSRIGRRRKRIAEGFVEKGSRRDAVQVLANGGIAAIIAIVHGFDGGNAVAFPAFLGAMAAATADTWSTEIGSTSEVPPRSILTWKVVDPGSSGGVTLIGFLGALAGAIVIGVVGAVQIDDAGTVFLAATIAGFSGSVVDSILGATVQNVNWCPECNVLTERAIHGCGTRTVSRRGLSFVDNDVVNGLTTLFGAVCAGLVYLALT
jgi:uncharacterized protein (TIGR00297 family)